MDWFESLIHDEACPFIPSHAWDSWMDMDPSSTSNPLSRYDLCQVIFRNYIDTYLTVSDAWPWHHDWVSDNRIIKYRRLLLDWSPWTDWNGGDCPIGPDEVFQVKFRDSGMGRIRIPGHNDYIKPKMFSWKNNGLGIDVCSYRIGCFGDMNSMTSIETDLDRFRKFFSQNPVM